MLIEPFPESSLNDEAGKLFMENYDEFFWWAWLMSSIHGMKTVKKCEKDVEMKPASPVKRIFEEIGQR